MSEDARRAWLADVLALVATAGGLWACADVEGAREIAAAILVAQLLSSFGGWIWGSVALVLAVALTAGVLWYGQAETAVLLVLGGLAVHRRAVWQSERDDHLSLALALLLVLFAILEDSHTLSHGAALVASTGPWLLAAPALRTVPVVFLSAALGYCLPPSPLRPDLSVAPALADLHPPSGPDDRAVIRVFAEDLEPPRYLRAAALDRFDGMTWTRTLPAPTWPILTGAGPNPIIIERGRAADGWLLGVGELAGVVPLMGPFTRTAAAIRVDGSPEPVRYALSATPPWDGAYDDAPPDPRYLEVPAAVRALSTESSAFVAATPAETIVAMVAGLRRDHEYTLTPPSTDSEQPLIEFVRLKRPGHCEYFASTLAMWLRLEGIPSRLITGYAGGHLDQGVLVYTGDSAHVWVEARLQGRWVPVDPTPGAPLDPSIAPAPPPLPGFLAAVLPASWGHGYTVAASAVPPQTPWGIAALLLVFVGAMPWIVRRRTPRTIAGLHAAAERHLRKNGWVIPSDLPPVATAEWVRARIGDEAEPLVTLAWLHYRVRYGDEDQEPLLPAATAAWAAALRLRPPPG